MSKTTRIAAKFPRGVTADQVLAGLDLGGSVMMVTGADSGIGFATARALAARGARVYLGSISSERGEAARGRILEACPGADVRVLAFDLGDLKQVRHAAANFPEQSLHALICNAGVYGGPYALTVDGFERTLGVCYLGHFALTMGLLQKLQAAAPARVVVVSSQNHRYPRKLDPEQLPLTKENYSEMVAYGLAKRCLVVFANEFTRRYGSAGVFANSLHPGNLISTGIDQDSFLLRLVMRLNRPFARTPDQAASTSVWLATAPELSGIGGRYFVNCRETKAASGTSDEALGKALWEKTEGWL